MNETFGMRLRMQRERQQIDLIAISARTKINHTLLERLERDDVEHWPVGIFRRAYVRDYAVAIGLDPDAVLREFIELYGDPKPADPFSVAEAEESAGRSGTRLGKMVRSAMAGFMPRPSRSEPARMTLALESADDRESWDHQQSFQPARVASNHDHFSSTDVFQPPVAAPVDVERADAPAEHAASHPIEEPAGRREPDLRAAAVLCTRFAQVREWNDVEAVLGDAARALGAVGLVVWSHTGRGDALVAVLAHGYPPAMIARMPVVPRTADNAIAAAFRTTQRSVVPSEAGRAGALVLPLLAAAGCAGVLALELADGAEQSDVITAFAQIVASQVAPLIGAASVAQLSAAEAVSA